MTTHFDVLSNYAVHDYTQDRLPPIVSFPARRPEFSLPPLMKDDLSNISKEAFDIRTDAPEFVMSSDLQLEMINKRLSPEERNKRVLEEATEFAINHKKTVREKLKTKLRELDRPLNARQKGKLRSRREAKVHRVKEQALEKALKDTVMWLINHV